jgi:hypothetical protein
MFFDGIAERPRSMLFVVLLNNANIYSAMQWKRIRNNDSSVVCASTIYSYSP